MPDPAHGIELCEEAARLSEAPLYCGDEQTTRAAGMLGPCRRMHEAALEPRQSVANVWDVGLARVRSDGIREPQSAMGDVEECFPVGPARGFVRHPSHRGQSVRPQSAAGRPAPRMHAHSCCPKVNGPLCATTTVDPPLPASPRDLVRHIGGGHSGDCELVEPRYGVLTSEGKTDRAGKSEAGHVVSLTTHATMRTRVSAPVQEGTSGGHHACGRWDVSGRWAMRMA